MSSKQPSTLYGPVRSWRYGNSLGVDLLLETSICSFNCIYCQLGEIQRVTSDQKIYVPTSQVIEDLKQVDWDGVDLITFSGSGEPTLALNLGEVIHYIKEHYSKPVMILTNSTWLHDIATRQRVQEADIVDCKLDASSDKMLQTFNRPAAGVTLESILEGIQLLRDDFQGKLHLQCMFMPLNLKEAESLLKLILPLQPDLVQLNTPRRPYPKDWYLGSRGNHAGDPAPVEEVRLTTLSDEDAGSIEELFASSGLNIQSIYKNR